VEAVSPSFGRSTRATAVFHWNGNLSPAAAANPSPADGAINVNPILSACWNPGLYGTSREVYFGTANPPPLVGEQSAITYTPATLDSNTTYYWKVNEKNGYGTVDGPVWSFTTMAPQMKRTPRTPEAGGTVAARGENLPNEGKLKAFDNSNSTKWLDFSGTTWIQYHFGSGHRYAATEYSITSANDAPDRDPENWTLSASNDSATWVPLDARIGMDFPSRYQTRAFFIVNPDSYAYYKLDISCDMGSTTQLAEIDFVEYVDTTITGVGQGGPGAEALSFELSQNTPNPMMGTTVIKYQLPVKSLVNLSLYNVAGQLVRVLENTVRPAGRHQVTWDGRDGKGRQAANGVYVYRLVCDTGCATRKIAVVR
jgi:hypothetical protein